MPPGYSRFKTGHPKIDEEHQEFFRQVTALKTPVDAGAGRERTVELITNLQRCALGHFPPVRSAVNRVRWLSRELNFDAHRELACKLEGWRELLSFGGTPVSVLLNVHLGSSARIESHPPNVDCCLRNCASE